jgi:hypothetical protein
MSKSANRRALSRATSAAKATLLASDSRRNIDSPAKNRAPPVFESDEVVTLLAFTAANALHQSLQRRPTPELMRGAVHTALRINLDRFLNVPAARMPGTTGGSLEALFLAKVGTGAGVTP